MLLNRYHDIDFVFRLDIEDGIALINKAIEREQDERLFRQWVVQLPVMAFTGESMSFADYKAYVTGANIDWRPIAEIEAEIDEAERQLMEGGG